MEKMTRPHLLRGIGKWDLVALVINGVIGAGIFGLPSKLYALAGSWSLLAFVVCAIFTGLLILCFAEVASRFSETGGPYLYARKAFGPAVGFQVGWLMWLTRLTGFAALCNLLLGYLSYFIPAVASGVWRTVIIAALVLVLTTINILGVREAARVSTMFTVGKLVPLLLLIVVGLFFLEPQHFTLEPQPDFSSFSTCVLLLVFAFSGFEVALIPAGEVRNPRKDMPFALLAATGLTAVVYILIQVVCIGTLPDLAHSERPLADAGSVILGATGASIITIGALISISGTLNTGVLAAPRLLFAMAEQAQLPRIFAAIHKRFQTPYVAILATSTVMFSFAMSSTFISALKISTIIRLLSYMTTCAALIKLRRSGNADAASFSVPGGNAVALAGLALSVWLLASSTWHEAMLVAGAATVGLIIYFGYWLVQRRGL